MKKYEEINKKLQVANQIVNEIKRYKETIKDSKCDKYEMCFNGDVRFSSAKITISVDSYLGYYGSSSCGTVPIVKNTEIFQPAFISVLNRHFEELMFETANLIKENALAEKDKAIEELKSAISKLEGETN